jgi:hypothetical protein
MSGANLSLQINFLNEYRLTEILESISLEPYRLELMVRNLRADLPEVSELWSCEWEDDE